MYKNCFIINAIIPISSFLMFVFLLVMKVIYVHYGKIENTKEHIEKNNHL